MPRFWALLFTFPLFAATVPNRYIVELSLEPVAVHVARSPGRASVRQRHRDEQRRTAIRAQQAMARTAIEQSGGRIRGSLETLNNALLVEIPAAQAAALARAPGVSAVYAVRLFEMTLDHALPR